MRALLPLSLLLLSPMLSVAPVASAQTVEAVVATHSGACTTAGFEGLSEQLVRSHLCAFPGVVAEFTPHPNITLTSGRVHPLAHADTVRALRAAADETPFAVNSAFRTLVQQYALYHEGGCGLAAAPGNSNHQSGRAVDVDNYGAALAALTRAGCTHPYPSADPWHFDCPGPDMRSASVLVFQRLWNVNRPDELIAEDGAYGPETAARMALSPAGGFASDLCDATPPDWGAELLASTFGAEVTLGPGEELVGTIEMGNIGSRTWTSATELATTGPRDGASALAAPDWLNDHRAARVDGTVEPGDSYPFTFTVRAPAVPGEYTQTFGLVHDGADWFSDGLGPADDAVGVRILVVATTGPPVQADGGSPDGGVFGADGGWVGGDERPLGVHGCAASPGRVPDAPWWLLAFGLLGLRRRRFGVHRSRNDHL